MTEQSTVELKQLRVKRGCIKSQLTNFQKLIDRIDKENLNSESILNIRERVDKIKSLYDTFSEIQLDIEYLVYDETEIYEREIITRDEFYDQYFYLVSCGETLIRSFSTKASLGNNANNVQAVTETIQNVNKANSEGDQQLDSGDVSIHESTNTEYRNRCSIKLPTIKLPVFDGTFTTWRSFLDAFNTLINANPELTDTQRLIYLKSTVTGEPHELISSLETTDVNYKIALGILKKRYDNKRRIVNNHVLSILNIQPITRESANHLKQLI